MQKAVEAAGGLKPLAKACDDVSYQAVQRWVKNGCPAKRVLQVERAAKYVVQRYELRPDLYPPEEAEAAA